MKIADTATTLIGLAVIPYSYYLASKPDAGIGGWDVFLMSLMGLLLIWFKADAARNLLTSIFENVEKLKK